MAVFRLLFGLVLLLLGCGGGPQGQNPGKAEPRVLVLGFDGLEPTVVDLLISEGKLPHFERLRREGASGTLTSEDPLLSPIIWTTLATGRRPADHGVLDFVVRTPGGVELPIASTERKVRALWNLFSEAGKTVGVVGWWATWPAEPVNGTLVSDRAAFHFLTGDESGASLPGAISPEAAAERYREWIRQPSQVRDEELAAYARLVPGEAHAGFGFADEIDHLRWALAATATYRDVGLDLWRRERPALLLVYFEATDSLAHLFGHLFRRQDLAGELAVQAERFGGAVERIYREADAILGEFLAEAGDDTVLFVVSDHGFELGQLPTDPSTTRDLRRVSHLFHRLEGSFFVHGRGVRPGMRVDGATIYDLAPTVLAVAGMAAAEDMPGRVLEEVFAPPLVPPARVATYETTAWAPLAAPRSGAVDAAVLEKLRSLGYIGGGDTAPRPSRNQAAIAYREGRYREAARAYRDLLVETPDDASLHTDFAAALVALGRTEEARASLARAIELAPAYAPAFHLRGRVHESLGELPAAIADYRRSALYDDEYAPPRQALARLGEPVETRVARTPEERRSAELLVVARDATRRGDYAAARAALDEALILTPGAAVVFQYRANVAYLEGDRAQAIRELVRALEIEPDNALLRENLRRLQEKS